MPQFRLRRLEPLHPLGPPRRAGPADARRGDGGFTLLEVLVALVLVAVLAGLVIPVVLQQLERRHAYQLARDLRNIGLGVELFHVNLYPAYPSDIEDLFYRPGNDDLTLLFEPYPARLRKRWEGPYVDVTTLTEGGDVYTQEVRSGGFEGRIQGLFCYNAALNMEVLACSEAPGIFLALKVDEVRATEFELVNDILDGEGESDVLTGATAPSWREGRLRLRDGGGISPLDQVNQMYYLIAAFKD